MRKILYLWMICVVLCSLVSCNDSDDKTYSSYVSRFVWENRCNHRIEYFYVEGCITRSQGIKYGERAVKELEGPSPVDLQTFLDGRETHVIYDSFTEGVIIYCYMENYYPSGLGEVAVPKSLQDPIVMFTRLMKRGINTSWNGLIHLPMRITRLPGLADRCASELFDS